MHNNKKIFLSSIVWGEEYIEYFERLCLKSLLKNNIDKSKKISFNIYCFKDELHKIKNLKNIKKLKKLILINYYFLEKKRKEKYSYIADYQKKLIDTAKKLNNDYFIFCYPDTIFCENYIKFCTTKLEKFSLLLSPAPLVNFEDLPKDLDDFSKDNLSKIGNTCLSNFYENRINDYYRKSNINLWRNEHYTFYKSFNLHILGIKLKAIKEIKNNNYKSFDEDFFTFDNINYQDLYYVKNSQENIILTVESVASERNNLKNDKPSFANSIERGIEEAIWSRIYSETNYLNIFSFLHGNYHVVEKKNLSKIMNCEFVKSLAFLKIMYSDDKKKTFNEITKKKIRLKKLKKIIFNNGKVIEQELFLDVTEENYYDFIKRPNNRFYKICRTLTLIIVALSPGWLIIILNKILSKKVRMFNKTRHDLKFILNATPKKYVLKVCAQNMVKIIQNKYDPKY